MRISLIVAMDQNSGIGIDNRIPWRLPVDLKRFRSLTLGHHLLVGRRTFDSIGRPLPGRKMIVLTRDPGLHVDQSLIVNSLAAAIELARQAGETELFIGGGSDIYALALPLANRIYLTRVAAVGPADTFFPVWDPAAWTEQLLATHPADEANECDCSFFIYDRIEPAPFSVS